MIAAGPAFKQSMRKNLEEIMQHREDVTIVACDGAMPTLATFDCVPDFVVSVDPQEIIAEIEQLDAKASEALKAIKELL